MCVAAAVEVAATASVAVELVAVMTAEVLAVVLAVVLVVLLALTLAAAPAVPLPAALACGAGREAGRHADLAMTVAVPWQSTAAAGPRAVPESVLAFLVGRQH